MGLFAWPATVDEMGRPVIEYGIIILKKKGTIPLTIQYKPKGVCSQLMTVKVEEGVIQEIQVLGGCSGNLQGISKLLPGMKAEDAIDRMAGIKCGFKATSCPDQLSKALQAALNEEEKRKNG